jgi:hypothetical protein
VIDRNIQIQRAILLDRAYYRLIWSAAAMSTLIRWEVVTFPPGNTR